MNLNESLQQAIESGKSSRSKARFYKAYVSPALAQELLALQIEKGYENRTLRERYVEKSRRQILRGTFNEDTRSVKLSPRLRVVDGQHILHAIVSANKGVFIRLGLDVPETVLDTIDTNQKRTWGQTEQIKGGLTKADTHVGNALMELKMVATSPNPMALDGKAHFYEDDADKTALFNQFKPAVEAIREAAGTKTSQVNSAGYLSGFLAWSYPHYPQEVKQVVEFIQQGDPKGNPVLKSFLTFRDWMCRENLGNGTARKGLARGIFKMIVALHKNEPVGSRWLNSELKDTSSEDIQSLIKQCGPVSVVKPNAGGLTVRKGNSSQQQFQQL